MQQWQQQNEQEHTSCPTLTGSCRISEWDTRSIVEKKEVNIIALIVTHYITKQIVNTNSTVKYIYCRNNFA